MIPEILVAILMMLITVTIQTEASRMAIRIAQHPERGLTKFLRKNSSYSLSFIVLLMFFAHLMQALVWAATYVWLGALADLKTALYFSIVTFTTLGYGEIVLEEQWRLLASFEAITGIIMFGWTTAIVVWVMQKVYNRISQSG